jgi:hypothetical protein
MAHQGSPRIDAGGHFIMISFKRKTRIAFAVATATTGALLAASPANAAVTFDPATGTGFVGKGDVQTALKYNNTQLQKNASSLLFTSQQAAEQAMSQDATQDATQSGTQTVVRELSCVIDTKRKTFYNEGTREGVREGDRTGSREGSRAGTLTGNLSYTVAYDARVKNQITGFNLKGFGTQPAFTTTGDTVWGEPTFGAWSYDAWVLGETEWSGWVSEPGDNPAECDSNNPGIDPDTLSDVTTEGAFTEGDITEGAVEYGTVTNGAVSATGPAQLSVNGIALN